MLAMGEMPIKRAIIDGGITPYPYAYPIRKLILARDFLSFKILAGSRKVLEAAFPPQRFTRPGRDPKQEYDAIEAYLKTYSNKTIRNIFWSGNHFALPNAPAARETAIVYWYGADEKRARKNNIRFVKKYFPEIRLREFPKMEHAELVMIHPEEFVKEAEGFFMGEADE